MAHTTLPKRNSGLWITMHWLTAILMVAAVATALIAHDMPSGPDKGWMYNLHKTIGVTVFVLTALRLLYRPRTKRYQAAGPAWQKNLAKAAHIVLYTLLIAMPVTGYLSAGSGVDLFWLIEIPPVLPDAPADALGEIHVLLQYAAYTFVTLHVVGALFHHYFRRDHTLAAMVPGLNPHVSSTSGVPVERG